MVRLILASQSPARTKLLTEAGIRHTVLVSDVDEDAVQARYGVVLRPVGVDLAGEQPPHGRDHDQGW